MSVTNSERPARRWLTSIVAVIVVGLLAGCGWEKKRFIRAMLDYDATCEAYMDVYKGDDVASAKDALLQIIALSRTEEEKATDYWRFNLWLGLSHARLALIAEHEGNLEAAARLWTKACDYMLLQDKAYRAYERSDPNVTSANENSEVYHRKTVEEMRIYVVKLDTHNRVKWQMLRSNQSGPTSSSSP